MFKLSVAWLILLNCFTACAQQLSAEKVNLHFLLMTPDARAAGLGDTGTASMPDVYSLHWNAAKYAFSDDKAGIGFSLTPWKTSLINDMNLLYLASYLQVDKFQTIAGGMRFFTEGEHVFNDEQGIPNGSYKPSDLALEFAYIRKLSHYISLATTIKYIHSDIAAEDLFSGTGIIGNTAAADIGFFLKKSISGPLQTNDLSLSIAMMNIGPRIKYQSLRHTLPTVLNLGSAYTLSIGDKSTLTLALSSRHLVRESFPEPSKLSFGVDFGILSALHLRGGYLSAKHFPENGDYLTFGTGLNYSGFKFDFSYWHGIDELSPVNNTLRYSVSYNWN